MRTFPTLLLGLAIVAAPLSAIADGLHAIDHDDAVKSPSKESIRASFDVLAAHAHGEGQTLTFHMTVQSEAGAVKPEPHGGLAGAPVYAYVWPTSLDPSSIGFEAGTGILALAATSHPDFDDTPLYDEDADGKRDNDGGAWHSHWVVLAPNDACGAGGLSVRDIPEGETPALPATWPGLPLFIDSPAFSPVFDGTEVSVTVALPAGTTLSGVGYDGVTSALKVNADLHSPLLCVADVFDIASGDLSLPSKIK